MSKVSYSDQERCAAVAMYRKTRSYVQTIIVMGYPSRYVLHTWVRESLPGRRPLKRQGHRQSFSSEKKIMACERVMAGEPVRAVATDLGITNVSNVYAWLQQFTRGGRPALMSHAEKKRQHAATRQQLEASLPDNPEDLRALAAQLAVDNAVLRQELELVKKTWASLPEN